MAKVEVTRSFSQKVQVERYEPVEAFAGYSMEVEEKEARKKSKELFNLARKDVEESICNYMLARLKNKLQVQKRHPRKNSEEIFQTELDIDIYKKRLKEAGKNDPGTLSNASD